MSDVTAYFWTGLVLNVLIVMLSVALFVGTFWLGWHFVPLLVEFIRSWGQS